MKNKLIGFNLLIITIVIAIITVTGNYYYQKIMLKSRLDYTTELQRQLSNSFFLKMDTVEKSLEVLSASASIIDYLENDSSEEPATIKEQRVRDLFQYYEKIYPEYLNILLVSSKADTYVSNDAYRIVDDSFQGESWYQEAYQNGYSYQFYNAIRNLKSWKVYDNYSFLSISKVVEINGEKKGVLLIDLSLEEMKNFYTKVDQDSGHFFFLMNGAGEVILSPENQIVHRIKSEWFQGDEGIVKAKLLNRSYNLIYNKYEDKGLTIVSAYDIQKEEAVLRSFFNLSIFVALVAFVFAISWSIYFVSKVTKPLSKLSSLMKVASTGDLEVRFEEDCENEIQSLGTAFNKMVIKIKELLDIVYQEQKQKRDAYLQVMQEQIKPHFLYNTLDMIGWMARKHKALDIVHLIELMGNFFRISLSKGKEMISLADELKMISSYLDIQGLRYGNLFTYEINCPEHLSKSIVPRLCLQPLVENSIYHGIKESDNEQSLLKITVIDLDGGISIFVEDNGKPMDEEKMSVLNHCLSTNDWSLWEGGFGVQNVGSRLWHTFSKGSGLTYHLNEEGFTVAKITIYYQSRE